MALILILLFLFIPDKPDPVEGYGIHIRLLLPTIVVIIGVLMGVLGTKLVKWIFNKE